MEKKIYFFCINLWKISFPKLPPFELLPEGILLRLTELIRDLQCCLLVPESLLQLLNLSLTVLVLVPEVLQLPEAAPVVTFPLVGQHRDHVSALNLHTAGHFLINLEVVRSYNDKVINS